MTLRPPAEVRDVARTDPARTEVAAVLADAFVDDPSFRFITPDRAARTRRLPAFFRRQVDADLRRGTASLAVDGSEGAVAAALWLPPGVRPPLLRSPGEAAAMAGILRGGTLRGLLVDLAMVRHLPREDHWYLHYLGVAGAHQGRGLGRLLLADGLARADADRRPCWLETQLPQNVALYRSVGFEVVAEYDVPGGGPHFWGMRRRAVRGRSVSR